MATKQRHSSDPTRTLSKGQSVRLSKVAGTWRLVGAAGGSLFFLAEVTDTGSFPTGVVQNQLTQSNLFGQRLLDDRAYTVIAHGGSVEMDPARGYAQKSA